MANEMINISAEEQQFEVVRGIIDLHRGRAAKAVNEEALLTYWHVGCYISHKLKTNEWGAQVVTKLAEYLAVKDPTLKGYRRRNLYNMVLFYDSYSSPEFHALLQRIGQTEAIALPAERKKMLTAIVQNDSAQMENAKITTVQNDSAQMPKILSLTIISNHLEILSRKKNPEERLFYILYTYRERLKYKELCRCIDNDTFGTLMSSDGNNMSDALKQTYPESPLLLRDTVYIDLLGLPQKFKESKLRKAMVEQMKTFILELGKDFLFMEDEYRLTVGSATFKSDLLFYHRGLQCLVAVELKTGKFHPKDLGQLEFYLEALDRDVKRSNENPSIGILLCSEADSLQVEYALSRSMSPTMVAEYKRHLIPKEVLQTQMEEFARIALKK
ncbi:MAG: DUF1016 family protein [Bacteroidales bacterium]|nr:DUF1016 family protein [Bacteroidales bacterium]